MKELRVTTQDQIQVTLTISPSGFVKISDGQRQKSMALPTFTRAYFMNPSAVSVEPAVQSAKIVLPDGSEWVVHADSLVITKATKTAEPVAVPVRSEPEVATEVRVERVAAEAQPQQDDSQEVVSMSQNGAKTPRWAIALQAVLRSQGFSDEQIQQIIAAVSKDSRRKEREVIDTSTPEGKLLDALRKLWKTHKKFGITYSRSVSKDGREELVFENDVVYFKYDGQVIARYPAYGVE
jgi:hypothetical protein